MSRVQVAVTNGANGQSKRVEFINMISSDEDLLDIRSHSSGGGGVPEQRTQQQMAAAGGNASVNGGGSYGGASSQTGDIDIPGLGQYEDFHTIDWQRDVARDRMRHRFIEKKKRESFSGWLKSAHDSLSGWLCVFLVAILSGLSAGVVDIGSTWLMDLKQGFCPSAFYLNMEQCCWSSNETVIDLAGNCSQWVTWPEAFGFQSSGAGSYVTQYFCYMAIAVLFAWLSASLVKMFAPYACGSGIPEIKTILSGFIIRGYLGKWTYLIKSIGVMLSVASGLSLGKEGPMVHMACCCGNILAYLFPKYGRNEAKKREILSAASAAGVSVAFGAPIGKKYI